MLKRLDYMQLKPGGTFRGSEFQHLKHKPNKKIQKFLFLALLEKHLAGTVSLREHRMKEHLVLF